MEVNNEILKAAVTARIAMVHGGPSAVAGRSGNHAATGGKGIILCGSRPRSTLDCPCAEAIVPRFQRFVIHGHPSPGLTARANKCRAFGAPDRSRAARPFNFAPRFNAPPRSIVPVFFRDAVCQLRWSFRSCHAHHSHANIWNTKKSPANLRIPFHARFSFLRLRAFAALREPCLIPSIAFFLVNLPFSAQFRAGPCVS